MKLTPVISIIIPTYNHANFLGRALSSVINQTYTNWELIVVDNHRRAEIGTTWALGLHIRHLKQDLFET